MQANAPVDLQGMSPRQAALPHSHDADDPIDLQGVSLTRGIRTSEDVSDRPVGLSRGASPQALESLELPSIEAVVGHGSRKARQSVSAETAASIGAYHDSGFHVLKTKHFYMLNYSFSYEWTMLIDTFRQPKDMSLEDAKALSDVEIRCTKAVIHAHRFQFIGKSKTLSRCLREDKQVRCS